MCIRDRWGYSAVVYAKTAEPMELPFGLRTRVAQRTMYWMGVKIPPSKGESFWERRFHCRPKYREFLLRVVQERSNRVICHLYCGLGWAEGSTSSIVFARWRQCSHMGRHIGATSRIRLNRRSAVRRRCCLMSNYSDHLFVDRLFDKRVH